MRTTLLISALAGLAFASLVAAPAPVLAQFAPTQEDEPDRIEETPAPTLTKAPELQKFVEPVYPPALFAQGVAGDVTLNIDIDESGSVTQATVVRSSAPEFEAPAVAAALQFRFSPAEVDFAPSAIRIEYVLRFEPVTPEPDVIAGKPANSAPPLLP
ncbi:MAG: energy transducer TonB, partial [Myxococcota bacterium]